MKQRIAVVGAGSIGFIRQLMRDILAVQESRRTTFSLMDIRVGHLEMVGQLCRHIRELATPDALLNYSNPMAMVRIVPPPGQMPPPQTRGK